MQQATIYGIAFSMHEPSKTAIVPLLFILDRYTLKTNNPLDQLTYEKESFYDGLGSDNHP